MIELVFMIVSVRLHPKYIVVKYCLYCVTILSSISLRFVNSSRDEKDFKEFEVIPESYSAAAPFVSRRAATDC